MFEHRFTLFRLFGTAIRVDTSWIFVLALAVWSLAVAIFPMIYADLPAATHWWMAVAGAVGLLLSVAVHEAGHLIAARGSGAPGSVTLLIFGGMDDDASKPDTARAATHVESDQLADTMPPPESTTSPVVRPPRQSPPDPATTTTSTPRPPPEDEERTDERNQACIRSRTHEVIDALEKAGARDVTVIELALAAMADASSDRLHWCFATGRSIPRSRRLSSFVPTRMRCAWLRDTRRRARENNGTAVSL